MKKSFLSQFIDLAVGSGFALLLGIITTPIVTRLIDPYVYGQFSMFRVYVSLAVSVLLLGLDQALGRYYFLCKSDIEKNSLFKVCIEIPLYALAVLGIIAIIAYNFLKSYVFFSLNLLLWFLFTVFCSIFHRFITFLIRMQYRTKLYAALNILLRVIYIVSIVILIVGGWTKHLYVLLFSNVISTVAVSFVAFYSNRNIFKVKDPLGKLHESNIHVKELLNFGVPLIISTGVMHIFQATDKFCIKYFGNYTDVGIYSSAQNLMSIFSVIQTSFILLWAPKSVEHFEQKKEDKDFYRRMNQYITVLMFTFGTAVLIFKDVITYFLGKQYRESIFFLPFLMFNPIMYTISESTVMGISFYKKSMFHVYIVAICSIVNLILNISLIPIIGMRGAAVSTGISYILFFTLRTFVSKHFYNVQYDLGKLYLTVGMFIILALYSMYHVTDILFCIFACVFIGLVFFIYWESICEMICYLIQTIRKGLKKKWESE